MLLRAPLFLFLALIVAVPNAVAASPSASSSSTVHVSWGSGVAASLMLKPGESRTFVHGELKTGEAVGCVNTHGFGATTTVPRFVAGAPLLRNQGFASASKPGKGSVTIRVTRPTALAVTITCN